VPAEKIWNGGRCLPYKAGMYLFVLDRQDGIYKAYFEGRNFR